MRRRTRSGSRNRGDVQKTQFPMLVFPVKAALSFLFVYHGVAGMRHLVWDMSAFGIDNENAKKSSMFVFASSVAGRGGDGQLEFLKKKKKKKNVTKRNSIIPKLGR